jgi:calcium binding protein 39
LVDKIEILPFEGRKDTAHIFNNLIRKNLCNFSSYVNDNFAIVVKLLESYADAESALVCGSMLRECIRYDEIAERILNSEYLWLFFDKYVHMRNFEVASDSFNTLKELLTTTRNKAISSRFLDNHYDEVMQHYEVRIYA